MNKVLSLMNALYWDKDFIKDKAEQEDYLHSLYRLAGELNLEGLQTEIEDYLNIMEE